MGARRRNRGRMIRAAGSLVFTAGLTLGCTDTTGTAPTYTVGGMVSGLAGSGLVLRDNDVDDLLVTANGAVVFATPLDSGAAYHVTVFAQPSSPAQSCVVTGGRGTVAQANVTSVRIFCATNIYTVGGTVSGLLGSGLVLRNNGGDDLPVSADGPVTFATPMANRATYGVTVVTQPTSPAQTCNVTGASGTVARANVTTVAIVCATNIYTVGGMVSGLVGQGLVLRNNGGDDLPVSADGPVTFATPVASGDTFSVAVFKQPTRPAQTCVVNGGSGTMVRPKVTTVVIACVTDGAVRVAVSTSGADIPSTYTVYADPGASGFSTAVVPTNGTVSLGLASRAYLLSLGVARNCSVTSPNPMSVSVAAGATTDVAFKVTCLANGIVQIAVATTGTDVPAAYDFNATEVLDGWGHVGSIPANGTVSFAVAPGRYVVKLTVPLNCTVVQGGSASYVDVASGATSRVAFSVTCIAPGRLRVTVATTGPNAPSAHALGVDPIPNDFGAPIFRYSVQVRSNGVTLTTVLPVGRHVATLEVVDGCTVTSPNPLAVTLTSGVTTNLGFTVACP